MEALVECCAGLDVHQGSVVVCLLKGAAGRKVHKEVRTFGTMTSQLMEMADWLEAEGCRQVGMESTGVYWMPVYGVLEERLEVVVGNARHIAKVPGRKTDVADAEWIAQLLRHGLIKKSFVPPKPLRQLRDILRYRRSLVEARSAERNRLLKVLECANVKLSSVATDVFGVSGMLMVRALARGEQDARQLAQLARGLLRKKKPQLVLALEGRLEQHHRDMLRMQLGRLDALDADIAALEQRVEELLKPYEAQVKLLCSIPGVQLLVAATLIAEVGVDMTAFPSPRQLASWCRLCPGSNESAGKKRPASIGQGNVHLRTVLVEAARSASRAKGTYLRDKFHRLRARRGSNRAAVAIAHKLLKSAWHVLKQGKPYKELGESWLDERDKGRVAGHLVRRLERLGYGVTLQQSSTCAPSAA